MKTIRETTSMVALGSASQEREAVREAFQEVQSSFENFCLLAGIEAFQDLLEEEAADLCGERHQRHEDRRRWGKSPVAFFHGGRVDIERVRTPDGQRELELPSLAAGQRENWLGRWAMNQMLINVSTRRFRRSVRLPDGDVVSIKGDGTSKSAVSRKFVALSSAKLKDWLASDLSSLDLLAIQICTSRRTWSWSPRSASTPRARSTRWDGSRGPPRMPPRFRRCSTTWSSSTRWWCGCSSSTAPSPRRSAAPSAGTRRSSAARFTRPGTLPSVCQRRRRPVCARLSGRPGRWRRAEQLIRNLARRLDKEWPGIAATILEG